MLAADTLASYGSLAMFKDVTRIARTGSYTLVGASGELSDYHALLDKLKGLAQANANCDDGFEHGGNRAGGSRPGRDGGSLQRTLSDL